MRIESVPLETYATALPETGGELFHTRAALSTIADHATGDLRTYVGYKGDRPAAALPVFVRRVGPATVVTSPPPGFGLPYLGPVVLPASPKRRMCERLNSQFTNAVLDDVGADTPLTLVRLIAGPKYTDPRPYLWAGFDVSTSFTYRIDVTGDFEDVLGRVSRSLRKELRRADALNVTVTDEGATGARHIYDDVAARYREQGKRLSVPWPFVRDLIDRLGRRAKSFVARDTDGTYLGGLVVLVGPETAYFWQGGARTTYERTSVTSILNAHVLRTLTEDPAYADVTDYDLVGANTERLCDYKAKYNGDLVPYYTVESNGAGMSLARRAFGAVSK